MNQHWKFSKSHVRFLAPENLVPYLAIRAVFINIGAFLREKTKTQDLDDDLYKNFIQETYECSCLLCRLSHTLLQEGED